MLKIKDKYFYKTFFRLLGVVALQYLIVFSVNLADSIMLGKFNETAMSGVSLANQIQFFLQCLINGVCNGLVVLGSQYWGKKDTDSVKKVFSAAFAVGAVMSLIMGIVVIAFPQKVLGLLSDEAPIVAEGVKYIKIMGFSYLIFAVINILISLMRCIEKVSIGFASSSIALVVNIGLNFVLIFGTKTIKPMGVEGAAYATLISRFVELGAVLIYVFLIEKRLRLKLRDFFSVEKDFFVRYLKSGLPLVGSGSSWGIAMTVQTSIIGRLGAAAIGANAVVAPIFQVVSVLYQASSSASSVLIGKTVGENDVDRVKLYAKKLQILFLIMGVLSGAMMFFTKDLLIGFYDITPETRALAVKFIILLSVTVVGSAYEAPCLCGIVSGGGDTKFVLINDIIFMWCLVLPMAALSAFVFKWSIPLTFFILKSDQISKCFVAVVKVNRFKWIKQLTNK